MSSLHIKKFIYREKECILKHFVSAALNFASSFLRNVDLGGKMLKILMPA